MKKISLYVFLFFLVIGAPTIGWYTNFSVAIILLIACTLAFFLLNPDKIESIKVYGLEAKLRKTIIEANATIEQLKTLAVVLAEPTISLIATNGISFPMPISYRQDLINKINEILKSLNISQDDIQKMNAVHTTILRILHQLRILVGTVNPPANLMVTLDNNQLPTPGDYEQFLINQNALTPEKQELILDLKHYIETGEIRRPDSWQQGTSKYF